MSSSRLFDNRRLSRLTHFDKGDKSISVIRLHLRLSFRSFEHQINGRRSIDRISLRSKFMAVSLILILLVFSIPVVVQYLTNT